MAESAGRRGEVSAGAPEGEPDAGREGTPRDFQDAAGSALQVDFYVIDAPSEDDVRRFACRLAEKAWRAGNRVWIHAAGADAARALDVELWTFREESFVPHALAGADVDDTPVLIGHGPAPLEAPEVLINLDVTVPEFASRCARVAEIVGGDDAARAAARARFRHYRARGCTPDTHTLGAGAR